MRSTGTSAGEPAWARLDIECTAPGVGERASVRETWLLSEAWWGDAVQPPPSLRLLTWLWSRGPLLIFWHIYLLAVYRDKAAAARGASETASPWDVMMAVSAFVVAAGTQAAVTVALVLWVIPYGPWRSGLTAVVRAVTAALGDSYVLLEHDMQRAALVSRYSSSLSWLASRVRRIAVVAHSQGGAIAHEALMTSPADVDLFVSVGSGLEKLAFLKMVRHTGEGLSAAALVVPFSAFGAAAMVAGVRLDAPAVMTLGGGLLFAALLAAAALLKAFRGYRERVGEDLAGWALRDGVTWVDIHATHDLVPMGRGSILEDTVLTTRVATVNRRSVLADHTAYFGNKWHFQPALWRALASLSRALAPDAAAVSRWAHHQQVHSWQARALEAGHFAIVAAGLLMLAFHRSVVAHWGRFLDGLADSQSFWGVDAAVSAAQSVVEATGLPSPERDVVRHALTGALALAGGLALWWTIAGGLWSGRSARRWRALCRGGGSVQPSAALMLRRFGPAWTLVIGSLPLWLVVLYSALPGLFTPDSLGASIRFIAATALLLFAMLVVVLSPVATSALWEESRRERSSVATNLASLAALVAVLPALAVWLWPPLRSVPQRRGYRRIRAVAGVLVGLRVARVAPCRWVADPPRGDPCAVGSPRAATFAVAGVVRADTDARRPGRGSLRIRSPNRVESPFLGAPS